MLTATEVSATSRMEDHLLYLAHIPMYPRKLAAVSHCKWALDFNIEKVILKSWSNCCPQKRLSSLEDTWSCWSFLLPILLSRQNQAIRETVIQMPWFASWHIKVTQNWFMMFTNSNSGQLYIQFSCASCRDKSPKERDGREWGTALPCLFVSLEYLGSFLQCFFFPLHM